MSKFLEMNRLNSKFLELFGIDLEIAVYVAKPPSLGEIIIKLDPERAFAVVMNDAGSVPSEYVHWDRLRHLKPPVGMTSEEWWLTVKSSREGTQRKLALKDAAGYTTASYTVPDEALELLHYIDRHCSGEIAMPEVVTADSQARRHYLVNSLMEEAIRSSQLEGATTSRRIAKELLRTGRKPRDRSETMILNNYRALTFMREEIGERLTPQSVLELQRILTEGTLDHPDAAGRLQTIDDERIVVADSTTGKVLHTPPPADQLPRRLEDLCEFANADSDVGGFMHPVIRAILLHFWLAYDHPFEDGNGRTARALFYWQMRKRGYWLVDYLSISRILRQSPSRYARSFLFTETDDLDTTYFLLHQLATIRQAVEELHRYLRRKVAEVKEVERLVRDSPELNHRQLALLGDAVRDPGAAYTLRSHATTHGVTHETARSDLGGLSQRGLLERHRSGRQYVFTPSPGLPELLKRL